MRAKFRRLVSAGLVGALMAVGLVAAPPGAGIRPASAADDAVIQDGIGRPFDLVFDSDGGRAFVSIDGEDFQGVLVFDTATWTQVDSVALGAAPRHMDLTNDGSTLLVAMLDSTVVEIDTSTVEVTTTVDLSALLSTEGVWDVREIGTGDILVTGGRWTTNIVRYQRSDPTGTAQVVGSSEVIPEARIYAEFGADEAVVHTTAHSPDSVYVLDVTQAAAPVVAEDDHGDLSPSSNAALDLPRDRLITSGGQAVSLATGDTTELGFSGHVATDTITDTLWVYSGDSIQERDLPTMATRKTFQATCPRLDGFGSDVRIILGHDRETLVFLYYHGHLVSSRSGGFCVETLDGMGPVPGAPANVQGSPGVGSVDVTWDAPASTPVTVIDYLVTASPGGQTCTAATTSCTVEGLTNDVAYTFTVASRGGGEQSEASAASAPVTPLAPPPAPTNVTVGIDGSVSWTAASGLESITLRYREAPSPGSWLDALITGGSQRPIGEHSYGVKIFGVDGPDIVGECGGVLIDPEWILTAAHCTEYQPTGTYYLSLDYFSVVIGLSDWTEFDDDPESYRIFSDSVIVHSEYDRSTFANDLALVRLERTVPASLADPIPLYPFDSLSEGDPAFITGWGAMEGNILPDVLRGVATAVDADCGLWPSIDPSFDPARTMCTNTAPTGVCGGDSGGPVVVNADGALFLAGTVSFGSIVGCGVDGSRPDAHVRVSAYVDWIEERTGALWTEVVLSPSATSYEVGDLPRGRTYVVAVEANNSVASAFALQTITIPGMAVLGLPEIGVDCSSAVSHPFVDVPVSSFASGSVGCIFELGITTGTSSTTYSPSDYVTREQMAAFISRFIEAVTGEPCTGSHSFIDVPQSSFASGSVACIFELGITTGTSSTTYSPDAFVAREQMAAFVARVYRAVTGETCSIATTFGDVPSTSFAYRDVGCIFELGITTGTSTTTYSPGQFVTREQMAAFVERLFNAVILG